MQAFPLDFTPEQLQVVRLPAHRDLVVQAVRNANLNGETTVRVPVEKNGAVLEQELKKLGFEVFVDVEAQAKPKGKDQVVVENVDVLVVSWPIPAKAADPEPQVPLAEPVD